MKKIKILWAGIAVLSLAMFSFVANADTDAEEFVDEASAKGLAEIETGKMALEKGTSKEVKDFARKMIDDHTKANMELAAIAKGKEDWEVADDVELMNKAKAFILKLRDGDSFDVAYANNQVVAHEQTIELFREASREVRDPELKAFIDKTLPKLENHLVMARELAVTTKRIEESDGNVLMDTRGQHNTSARGVDNMNHDDMDHDDMDHNNTGRDNMGTDQVRPRPGTTTNPQ